MWWPWDNVPGQHAAKREVDAYMPIVMPTSGARAILLLFLNVSFNFVLIKCALDPYARCVSVGACGLWEHVVCRESSWSKIADCAVAVLR